MKLTIEPTGTVVLFNGAPVRRWSGLSEQGLRVEVLVAAIAVPDDAPPAQAFAFEAELHALPTPRIQPPGRRRLRPLPFPRTRPRLTIRPRRRAVP